MKKWGLLLIASLNALRIIARRLFYNCLRTFRIAWIQASYPTLKCHHTVDIIIRGRISVVGHVNIGPYSRIYVEKGTELLFGGDNMILSNVLIAPLTRIHIGNGTSIQDDCILLGNVSIGQGTLLAPRVFISSGSHYFRGSKAYGLSPWLPIKIQDRLIPQSHNPVSIGRDCWIGINSTINPGSVMSTGCIVGANSVVTGQTLGSYAIYAGSPVKIVGYRWISENRQLSTS